jgi:hypothetical protein
LIRYLFDEQQQSEQGYVDALCPKVEPNQHPTMPLPPMSVLEDIDYTPSFDFCDSMIQQPPELPETHLLSNLHQITATINPGIEYISDSSIYLQPSLSTNIPLLAVDHSSRSTSTTLAASGYVPLPYIFNEPSSLNLRVLPQLPFSTSQARTTPAKSCTQELKSLPSDNQPSDHNPPKGVCHIVPRIPPGVPVGDVWKTIVKHWEKGIPENGIPPLQEWRPEWRKGNLRMLWSQRETIAVEFLER